MSVSTRWRAVLLGLLAAALYLGAVPAGYAFDDSGAIEENPVVTGQVPLLEAFVRDFWGRRPAAVATYRPIVVLSYAAERRVTASPWLPHAANVLLHALAVALVYLAGRSVFGEGVAITAAIFAAAFAAPGEAVDSVVGRADLLLAICVLAGLAAHRAAGRRGAARAALALGAGLLCKESAAFAPAAWLALDLLRPPESSLRLRRGRFLAYGAVLAGYTLLRRNALGRAFYPHAGTFDNPVGAASGWARVFGAGHVFLERYAHGLIDPFQRLYACSAPACGPSNAGDPLAWLGLAILAALVAAVVLLRRRMAPVAAGLAWFLVFFLPVSNVLVSSITSYGERLLYVPCIGLGWAVAAAVERQQRPWLTRGLLFAFLALNAVALQLRHRDWRSEDELYITALDVAPDSALLQANAAAAYYERHDAVRAEEHARRALELWHPYALASSILASSVDRQGRTAEAEKEFRTALAGSTDSRIVEDYARFLTLHHRQPEAVALLEAQLRGDSLNAPLRDLLRQIKGP